MFDSWRIGCVGLAAKNEQLLQAVEEVEGVAIGAGKCAVDKNGGIIPASRLTPQQLRSELLARGLSTVGKRTELYKRVQASTTARDLQSWTLTMWCCCMQS